MFLARYCTCGIIIKQLAGLNFGSSRSGLNKFATFSSSNDLKPWSILVGNFTSNMHVLLHFPEASSPFTDLFIAQVADKCIKPKTRLLLLI